MRGANAKGNALQLVVEVTRGQIRIVAGQRLDRATFSHRRGHWFDPSIAHSNPQVSGMIADLAHWLPSSGGSFFAPKVTIQVLITRYFGGTPSSGCLALSRLLTGEVGFGWGHQ